MIDNKGNGEETLFNVCKCCYMMMKARTGTTGVTGSVSELNCPFKSL